MGVLLRKAAFTLNTWEYSFLLLLLTVVFSGCAATTPALHDDSRVSPVMTPEVVLAKIARPDLNIFKAMANIEVNRPGGRHATKAALLIKKPARLRIEAIPIIGPVNLFLSVQEDVLKVFVPQKGAFYLGKATPENLANVSYGFTAAMRVEDLLSIMLGTYPRIREKNLLLEGSLEGKRYRIDMVAEGRKVQSIWVDLSNYHLAEVQIFNACDRVSYTARFEAFDKVGLFDMPLKITLLRETDDHPRVIIRYSSIEWLTEVEGPEFDLQIPPGTNPIYLD
jgi:hypothetical protein